MNDEERDREYESNKAQAEAQVEGWQRLANYGYDAEDYDAYAEALQEETDNILSTELDRTIRVVLCTGGPHCEVRWVEDEGNALLVCYGWFGAGKYERRLSDDEMDAMRRIIGGDFDEVASMLEGR